MSEENSAAAPEAADEFDSAFAEFAGAKDEPPVEAAHDAPVAEQQAEEKKEEVAAEAKPEEQPAAPVEQKVDWEHRFRSEVGRQAALQRKIQELESQVTSLKQQPAETPDKPQVSQQMARLMEDFPEIAEAMQAELDARTEAIRGEFRQHVEPLKEVEQQRAIAKEELSVKEVYPDFVETVRTQDFLDWFQRQPAAVQALAGSSRASDAIAMLDYYTGGKRATPQANADVQEIREKRQQALLRNVNVRNSAPPPVGDSPDDFENAFAYYAKKAERQRA